MNIYETIIKDLEQGKIGIVATVIERAGSAPRSVGAKMFIGEDGSLYGTVGGGLLESLAYDESMAIMGENIAKTIDISMDSLSVESRDMLCGGRVRILLEPVLPEYLEVYKYIVAIPKLGESSVVITRFGQNDFSKTIIRQDGCVIGSTMGEKEQQYCSVYLRGKEPVLNENIFIEPTQISSELYIFGAGHVAQCLAKIARIVGFYVTVIDNREEFLNVQRFPDANEILRADFVTALRCLIFTGTEYIVIMTRSQEDDARVLETILKKQVKYIGMIGSTRKIGIIKEHLKNRGCDETVLRKIRAPIGFPIRAETPEELAVSIAAELISTRAGG
jgi:xanthine dehydrogenase accessory factor